jgi:hypothetical protein
LAKGLGIGRTYGLAGQYVRLSRDKGEVGLRDIEDRGAGRRAVQKKVKLHSNQSLKHPI